MSVEIRAGYSCPHLILEEPVRLGADRRSMLTRGPVSGAASVRVLVNDSIYVPPSGLLSPAALTSAKTAPYTIERCVGVVGPDGNLFEVRTGSGSVSVRLPEGARLSLEAIVRFLRSSPVATLVDVEGSDGRLSLEERNRVGKESFISVSGRGADSLGFQAQKGARGATVYPGWDVVSREDVNPTTNPFGVLAVPARYPAFREPIRGNPSIKVTYAAMPERCPRCGATYVENDYRFDPSGDVLTIENEDLLYQACLKAILTVQGSNPFHPTYGSKVSTRVGAKAVGASAALLKEDVQNALRQVQNLQQGQRRYQLVKDRELLRTVQSVDVRASAEDPTVFFIDVTVITGSNRPVRISTVFSVPGAVALAGSNGLSLGLSGAGLGNATIPRLLADR